MSFKKEEDNHNIHSRQREEYVNDMDYKGERKSHNMRYKGRATPKHGL